MGNERADAWLEAAEYAAAVAGVGELAARDRGVSVVRIETMQWALEAFKAHDPDGFYVCINRYATEAAQAVARMVAIRAEDIAEKAKRPASDNEPTDPAIVHIPPEAKGPTE